MHVLRLCGIEFETTLREIIGNVSNVSLLLLLL